MIARRLLVIAAATWLAVPSLAQVSPAEPPAPAVAPVPATARVELTTSVGVIVIAVETERAPVTAANFLRYVREKRLDGTSFYRALNFANAPGFGLIQGGTKGDLKRTLKPIAHEPTSKTGILHTDGTVSMARGAPGSAAGDFFIVLGAIPSLDAQPGGDPGFAAFGHVVEGLDVVKRIQAAPVSATAGEGAMKGQMITAPVRIVSARRLG